MPEQVITEGVGDTRIVAGLTWRQTSRAENGVPIWQLDLPGTHWVLKDYGPGATIEAFSGVRLVSGGPVVGAGKWASIDEAMRGAAPYLREDLTRRAADLMREADARSIAAANITAAVAASADA